MTKVSVLLSIDKYVMAIPEKSQSAKWLSFPITSSQIVHKSVDLNEISEYIDELSPDVLVLIVARGFNNGDNYYICVLYSASSDSFELKRYEKR
jgi:hypothetical protein